MVLLMLRIRLIVVSFGVLLASTVASAQSVNLAWDASTDPSVTGYVVKWGTRANTYTSTMSVGNRTTWTVSGLVPDQKYYFVVTSVSSTGLSSLPSNEVSNDALIVQTGGVLSDQRPSVFWHNQTTGQVKTWHVVGQNVIDTRTVNMTNTDPHWKVVGTGDLNGDGFSDILWRHDTQGWLAYWFLQYDAVVGTGVLSVARSLDINWEIKGVGDVDGDHYADIVWQHTDGTLAVWIMRGATVMSTRVLSVPKVADRNWKVAGVVDTNGDGYADLIFQDAIGGWLAIWFLRGSDVLGTYYLSIGRMTDLNWRVQAAGDIDGTGIAKILWRHLTGGWVATWSLSGNVVTGTYFFNPNKVDNQNWKIVGGR
jgi:hypothetical protein